MKLDEQPFRYDADRSVYTSTALAFGFLILIESSLLALLIFVLVPVAWAKTLLLIGLLALNGWAITKLRQPLTTFHALTPHSLYLRYAGFQAELPRSALVAAQPVQESVGGLATLSPRHDAEHDRVVALFSARGQILLTLSEPHTFHLGRFQRVTARHVLFNVDQSDVLLAALNLPQSAPVPATHLQDWETISPNRSLSPSSPPASAEVALLLDDLTRHFGEQVVVDGLNLRIRRGEIFGFLGPNGAGKTTTIKMIVGLLRPTAGRVVVAGHDVWVDPLAAKAAFGYVPDRSLLYERLTGVEYLQFLAQMRSIDQAEADREIDYLLDLLDLTSDAHKLSGAYSFGMKRKLALAGALLHRPPVLILDEPLNGLDPRSARRLKDLLVEMADQGKTIFLSTHDLHTAESVCHRAGIFYQGQLMAEGSADELRTLTAVPDLESVFLSLTEETSSEVSS
ncbi:ATP-binding cassette domain-containing protein [bacterium]|nr:ATP-binding cassette domain-containing protein [bacterium]